jgi:hypothetical protein
MNGHPVMCCDFVLKSHLNNEVGDMRAQRQKHNGVRLEAHEKKSLTPASIRTANLRMTFELPAEGLANGLRFKVGDEVQANIYGFVNGQVIGLWDAGYVYYIETEDEETSNVWAPQDVDHFVRARPPE